MRKDQLISHGILLRKQGKSYKKVAQALGISPATSYLWLSKVKLNGRARQALSLSRQAGREKGFAVNRANRLQRDLKLMNNARLTVRALLTGREVQKAYCALLYWAEGGKRESGVSFMNSDPVMIKVFVNLLKTSFDIDEGKLKAVLHLHPYHHKGRQMRYWSLVSGIPKNRILVYNKLNSGKNLRTNYPGCIQIRYYDVRVLRELIFTYKFLAKSLGA